MIAKWQKSYEVTKYLRKPEKLGRIFDDRLDVFILFMRHEILRSRVETGPHKPHYPKCTSRGIYADLSI